MEPSNIKATTWKDFPRNAIEFEERFSNEKACRDYWIKARWNGHVHCARCQCEAVWPLKSGFYECSGCGYQTSLTAGTLLQGTRKPLKVWFRAFWEISVNSPGLSAVDLQRILGFGSYKTAWTLLHKIRRALVSCEQSQLSDCVELDEATVTVNGVQTLVIVDAEPGGRIRMIHTPNNDQEHLKHFTDQYIDLIRFETSRYVGLLALTLRFIFRFNCFTKQAMLIESSSL